MAFWSWGSDFRADSHDGPEGLVVLRPWTSIGGPRYPDSCIGCEDVVKIPRFSEDVVGLSKIYRVV